MICLQLIENKKKSTVLRLESVVTVAKLPLTTKMQLFAAYFSSKLLRLLFLAKTSPKGTNFG